MATIVMLTRIKEDDKVCINISVLVYTYQSLFIQVKCHQYWPDSGFCVYDNIKVTLHKEEELTNYCLRQFIIEQVIYYQPLVFYL